MTTITKAKLKEAVLNWLVTHGFDLVPNTLGADRNDYSQIVLVQRLWDARQPMLVSEEV